MTENTTPDPEDVEIADDGTVRPADVDLPYKDDTSDGTTAAKPVPVEELGEGLEVGDDSDQNDEG